MPATDSTAVAFDRWAALAAAGGVRLQPVATALEEAAERLWSPMRLAVVGQIKQGKSTLVNAMLGEDAAATGLLEVTFNVNELCHGDQPEVIVHYRDGTPPERVDPARLRELVARDPARMDELERVRMVEHRRANDLLRSFRLVDTPGLFSVHGSDSANTLEHLGLETRADAHRAARWLHEESAAAAGRADAVLYLYQNAMHERDRATILDFLGPLAKSLTPLRAFGVMSRCDALWPPLSLKRHYEALVAYDPMAEAARLAEADLQNPDVGRLFYTILPVSGLVGSAARTLTGEHFDWLAEFAGLDAEVVAGLTRNASRLVNHPVEGLRLSTGQRRELVGRLGQWGLFRAYHLLAHENLGEDEVRTRLLADSGVVRLRELVIRHFGGRARTIKLEGGFRDVERRVAQVRAADQEAGLGQSARLADIASRLERAKADRHEFAELAVLGAHYNGELSLRPPEVADLLHVTGGHGAEAAARLAAPADTALGELERIAVDKVRAWRRREQDPSTTLETARAARVVRLCYSRVLDRVRRARDLLDYTDDPYEKGAER